MGVQRIEVGNRVAMSGAWLASRDAWDSHTAARGVAHALRGRIVRVCWDDGREHSVLRSNLRVSYDRASENPKMPRTSWRNPRVVLDCLLLARDARQVHAHDFWELTMEAYGTEVEDYCPRVLGRLVDEGALVPAQWRPSPSVVAFLEFAGESRKKSLMSQYALLRDHPWCWRLGFMYEPGEGLDAVVQEITAGSCDDRLS